MPMPDCVVEVLYGSCTIFRNCVGICKLHHKYVTGNQVLQKQCLRKQCRHLVRFPERSFWVKREEKRLAKKSKR